MNPLIILLSWLLHHANRYYQSPEFYAIKGRILKKYGKHICYDVQFIDGKRCFKCDGSGSHEYYDYRGHVRDVDYCWSCNGTGWYKRPVWNILARLQFGKYVFHQPHQRSYTKPDLEVTTTILGYIDHTRSHFSKTAGIILILLYEKGGIKRLWKVSGQGWRGFWWLPRNYAHNVIHLIKHGPKMIGYSANPFKHYWSMWNKRNDKPGEPSEVFLFDEMDL